MPTTAKKARYLDAETFCLGFPSYREDVYNEVERAMKLAQTGVLPYSGASPAPGRKPSRNQVIKALVVVGLNAQGHKVRARQGFVTKVGQADGE